LDRAPPPGVPVLHIVPTLQHGQWHHPYPLDMRASPIEIVVCKLARLFCILCGSLAATNKHVCCVRGKKLRLKAT
jgi:hypothetical protein